MKIFPLKLMSPLDRVNNLMKIMENQNTLNYKLPNYKPEPCTKTNTKSFYLSDIYKNIEQKFKSIF